MKARRRPLFDGVALDLHHDHTAHEPRGVASCQPKLCSSPTPTTCGTKHHKQKKEAALRNGMHLLDRASSWPPEAAQSEFRSSASSSLAATREGSEMDHARPSTHSGEPNHSCTSV